MRILNWNILAGGGARAAKIADYVAGVAPDVCVLTEFRGGGAGGNLLRRLADHGYSLVSQALAAPTCNSVAIFAARKAWQAEGVVKLPESIAANACAAKIDGFVVFACFCATEKVAGRVIDHLCEPARSADGTPTVVAGDFFYGPRGSAPNFGRPLSRLEQQRWTDVWKSRGDGRECWSFRGGRGKSRPDHFFVDVAATALVMGVDYEDGDERSTWLSDHCPMILTLSDVAPISAPEVGIAARLGE
jgi:endonuclease/exonuclease/phosphatase family metal-dependent hydrolase